MNTDQPSFSLFSVRQRKFYPGVGLRDEYQFAVRAKGEGNPNRGKSLRI